MDRTPIKRRTCPRVQTPRTVNKKQCLPDPLEADAHLAKKSPSSQTGAVAADGTIKLNYRKVAASSSGAMAFSMDGNGNLDAEEGTAEALSLVQTDARVEKRNLLQDKSFVSGSVQSDGNIVLNSDKVEVPSDGRMSFAFDADGSMHAEGLSLIQTDAHLSPARPSVAAAEHPSWSAEALSGDVLDVAKHITMIRNCAAESNLTGAIAVFNSLKQRDVYLNSVIYNTVLDACVECRDLKAAEAWMEQTRKASMADVVSYNTLIKAHLQSENFDKALFLMDEMKKEHLHPNGVTFNEMIIAMVNKSGPGLRDQTWKIVDEMVTAGVKPNQVTCSILLKCLNQNSSERDIVKTMELINTMEETICMDEVLLSSVVEACARIGKPELLSSKLSQFQAQMARTEIVALAPETILVLAGVCDADVLFAPVGKLKISWLALGFDAGGSWKAAFEVKATRAKAATAVEQLATAACAFFCSAAPKDTWIQLRVGVMDVVLKKGNHMYLRRPAGCYTHAAGWLRRPAVPLPSDVVPADAAAVWSSSAELCFAGLLTLQAQQQASSVLTGGSHARTAEKHRQANARALLGQLGSGEACAQVRGREASVYLAEAQHVVEGLFAFHMHDDGLLPALRQAVTLLRLSYRTGGKLPGLMELIRRLLDALPSESMKAELRAQFPFRV